MAKIKKLYKNYQNTKIITKKNRKMISNNHIIRITNITYPSLSSFIANTPKMVKSLHHVQYKVFSKQKITQKQQKQSQSIDSPNNAKQSQLSTSAQQQSFGLQTMSKTYQQIQVPSFQNKSFTNLTQLQRKIIQQNKFDLNHPQIKPKLASITSIPGIITKQNDITEINLGNIKVKERNEVFLSEIDPYNIPQDYDIKFDYQKTLTLVGKKIPKAKPTQLQKLNSNKQQISSTPNTQMSVSVGQSFYHSSIQQLTNKFMGQIGYKYQFNRKKSFKQLLLLIPFFWLIIDPIFSTISQYYDCINSIKQIESQEMKQIKIIKKNSMVNALLNNSDFNVKII